MEIPSVNYVLCMYLFLRIHLVRSGSSLDFSRNNLTEVPSAPHNMTVTEIDLKTNFIQEIRRNAFRNYTELANINLDRNGLQLIHNGVFDHISTLRVLSLQRNDIKKLPTDFGPSTTALGKFLLVDAIADTQILTHPYFGAFTSLGALTLHGCNIGNIDNSFLPPKIRLLLLGMGTADKFPLLSNSSTSLSWISMPNQKFKNIPDEAVAGLFRLGFLQLKNNEINNFPNFSHCKRLTRVHLENNKIPHIPREHIKGLDRIRVMCLHHNSLTNMTDISNLTTLETFTIGHNMISEIPSEYITGLPNMKIFECNDNKIHILPDISRYFPLLEELRVQGNNLKTLPDLYYMPSLSLLTVAQNIYACNLSLCWMRMLPWMKPEVTFLKDSPLCDKPAPGKEIVRFHPTDMECYNGKSLTVFPILKHISISVNYLFHNTFPAS